MVKAISELLEEVQAGDMGGTEAERNFKRVAALKTINDNEVDDTAARLDAIDARLATIEQRAANEQRFTAMVESQQLVFNTVALVAAFHDAFGVPGALTPCLPDDARVALRLDLLDEEIGELRAALGRAVDMRRAGQPVPLEAFVAIARELADVQYVLDGTFLELGLGGVKGHLINAIHASNMSKLGADGKPVYRDDGKVLKGPDYLPPAQAIAEIIVGALDTAEHTG